VAHGGSTPVGIHHSLNLVANLETAQADRTVMTKYISLDFLCIYNIKSRAETGKNPAVADLAARFGIKWRIVQHNNGILTFLDCIDHRAVHIECLYGCGGLQMLIAFEAGLRTFVLQVRRHLELAAGFGLGLLARHGLLVTRLINAETALTTHVGGQIKWETECVVQTEGGLAI